MIFCRRSAERGSATHIDATPTQPLEGSPGGARGDGHCIRFGAYRGHPQRDVHADAGAGGLRLAADAAQRPGRGAADARAAGTSRTSAGGGADLHGCRAEIYDGNGAAGGPLVRDKTWFFFVGRQYAVDNQIPSSPISRAVRRSLPIRADAPERASGHLQCLECQSCRGRKSLSYGPAAYLLPQKLLQGRLVKVSARNGHGRRVASRAPSGARLSSVRFWRLYALVENCSPVCGVGWQSDVRRRVFVGQRPASCRHRTESHRVRRRPAYRRRRQCAN